MSEISKKRQLLFENGIDLGSPLGNEKNLPPAGKIQEFQHGILIYHPTYGCCYLTQRVAGKWKTLAAINLGYPIADTGKTRQNDELCLFENGLIVGRLNGGDFVVFDNVYRAYLTSMGSGVANFPGWMGYPVNDTRRLVSNGLLGTFEQADIYQRNQLSANSIQGGIRSRYNQLGAENSSLGLPISNEYDLFKDKQVIGRASDFERGTIFWSAVGGAHALQSDFLSAYLIQFQGMAGTLGVPMSEERRSPGGRRFVNFEHGVLVETSSGTFIKVDQLTITLTKLQTDEDDDDLLVKTEVLVHQNGTVQKREKQYGEYSDQGTKDDFSPEEAAMGQFPINNGAAILEVNMEAWDVDGFLNFGDDSIARFSKRFSIDTLWDPALPDLAGKRLDDWYETGEGKFRASFRVDIDRFTINPFDTARFVGDLWWNVDNYGVAELSKKMYADTFADVDENDSAFWHQLLAGFYEDRYKKCAANGICFGICLEAIYALKGRSIFRQPIQRIMTTDPANPALPDPARNQAFQLRHGYQTSEASADLLSDLDDNRWNPVATFNQSRDLFFARDYPTLSIRDGNGAGHALVPYEWIENGNTLTIRAVDPNRASNPTTITIDRRMNTFTYPFSAPPAAPWQGGAGKNNGGAFFARPYHILANVPVTNTAAIGLDLTVLDTAQASKPQRTFAPLGITASGKRALFQVGGQAEVSQIRDGMEGHFFRNPNMVSGFPAIQNLIALDNLDGLGIPARPDSFVLTTSAERPAFFLDDLPDAPPSSDKWSNGHLAALIRSDITMPNLSTDALEPLYPADQIQMLRQEMEVAVDRAGREKLHFLLRNTNSQGKYHWYMASQHVQIRLETNAIADTEDLVTAEQIGSTGQIATFQAGGTLANPAVFSPIRPSTERLLKASLLNAASNRMWVLDLMKATANEPLSFQLNNGGRQLWVYNTNNVTDVTVQFWQNDLTSPDITLPGVVLPTNKITGFELVAPNSIQTQVYDLPGGVPVSSATYSSLHLDCRNLLHEWLVMTNSISGAAVVSLNPTAERPDSGGWFFCHERVVDFCIEDGDYGITVQSGTLSLVQFTIREGLISYAADLEGVVQGAGTNTLILNGLPLTIDAQAVRDKLIILPGVYGLSPDPIEHLSRPLATGRFLPTSHDGTDGWFYAFSIGSGETSTFQFQLCLDGTVHYNPVFEGEVQGEGTNTLTIHELIPR